MQSLLNQHYHLQRNTDYLIKQLYFLSFCQIYVCDQIYLANTSNLPTFMTHNYRLERLFTRKLIESKHQHSLKFQPTRIQSYCCLKSDVCGRPLFANQVTILWSMTVCNYY